VGDVSYLIYEEHFNPGGVVLPKLNYPDMFGSDLALLSDFNNDGNIDIAVSAAGLGGVYIVSVNSSLKVVNYRFINYTDLDPTLNDGDIYPSLVAVDVAGTGIKQLIIGGNRRILPRSGYGYSSKAWVLYFNDDGSTNATVPFVLPTTDATTRVGFTMFNLGDFNNDGVPDIGMGSPSDNYDGQIYLLWMTKNFSYTTHTISKASISTIPNIDSDSNIGLCVQSLGDMNGDNITDILIENQGNLYILFLNADSSVGSWNKIRDNAMCEYTYSFGQVGDLNGDGVTDLIGGGDVGLNNEVLWIVFVEKQNYYWTAGVVIGFLLLIFFIFVGFITCIYMQKNRTY